MVEFKGFEITVKVNNQHLAEYNDDDEEDSAGTITRYIQAEGNAFFSISARLVGQRSSLDLPAGGSIQYDVRIDGHPMGGTVAYEPTFSTAIWDVVEKKLEKFNRRRFKFSEIHTVEDDCSNQALLNLQKDLKACGMVEVRLWRITDVRTVVYKDRLFHTPLSDTNRIPEKALKGDSKSHCVHEPEACHKINGLQGTHLDPVTQPFAVFKFKYRSREALEALYIIHRPPALEDRNTSDLSREELLQLVSRLRRSSDGNVKPESPSNERKRLKQEADEEYDEIMRSARTKRTRQPEASSTGDNLDNIEVVDLTAD